MSTGFGGFAVAGTTGRPELHFLLDALGGLIVAGLGMFATGRHSRVPARRVALLLAAAYRYVIAGYRYALPAWAAALAASPRRLDGDRLDPAQLSPSVRSPRPTSVTSFRGE
jgi:hypothetical protein